jgi:replicative DNA helicase
MSDFTDKWHGDWDQLWPQLKAHDPDVLMPIVRSVEQVVGTEQRTATFDPHRVRDGESFIFDEPDHVPAVWGKGEQVLWPEGEGVMITGHQGVGKTTIAQQVVLHQIGARPGDFLGLPVADTGKSVLYLAMDRPRQAARSFRRMVDEAHREIVRARLTVWRGPLPINPLEKGALANFVDEICPGAGAVIVDSVKDLAPGISDDKVGAGLNSAWQEIIARDVQLMLLHHERKAANGNKRTHTLDDVYGSTWLTSGLGSVLALDGDPGDPTVEMRHLKQPADPIGPLTLRHDHANGITAKLDSPVGLLDVLISADDAGLPAADLARTVIGRSTETEQKKIRRQLTKLIEQGLAYKIPGGNLGGIRQPDHWAATPQARLSSSWGSD